jgi:drug/metabolite transporter (DMT)-like permease
VAALFGWLTLHEPLTVGLVVGFASIVSGFVLVNGGRGHG